MRELILTPLFERAFRRFIGKHPDLRAQIENTLRKMAEDINAPSLRTHHLSGQLSGLFACTVNYDCRIVFKKEKNPETEDEVLILLNIGTHDEVY